MTGIRASQKEKDLSRLLYRICGSGLKCSQVVFYVAIRDPGYIGNFKAMIHVGEILGCTSPKLPADTDGIIYLGDGRFHIESIMIHNPKIPAFKYDPYTKKITSETYHFEKMCSIRSDSIDRCRSANCFGLILGTLGRQGSTG